MFSDRSKLAKGEYFHGKSQTEFLGVRLVSHEVDHIMFHIARCEASQSIVHWFPHRH